MQAPALQMALYSNLIYVNLFDAWFLLLKVGLRLHGLESDGD